VTDFDDVHRRYWRDNWANREAAIPVRGGDIVERGGHTYAVLFASRWRSTGWPGPSSG
jgi:hypothetical protein